MGTKQCFKLHDLVKNQYIAFFLNYNREKTNFQAYFSLWKSVHLTISKRLWIEDLKYTSLLQVEICGTNVTKRQPQSCPGLR